MRGEPGLTCYTSESALRRPGALLAAMGRDLVACRELAWRLAVRDISVQYRQSLLGLAWAFIPPIATAVGLTFATRARVLNVGETDIPYPAYVMLSMALWQTFVQAVHGPLQALTNSRGLLTRFSFPREALVLSRLGDVWFNFGIKLVLIALIFLWYGIPVGWSALLAPVALLELTLLGTLVGLFLAPLGLLYRDVSRALVPLMASWFFLTPVIYPTPPGGTFRILVRLNPVTPVLVTVRELATARPLTELGLFLAVTGLTLVGLFVTWVIFRLAMPFVVERVGT